MAWLWLLILALPLLVALMLGADEPTRRLARHLAPWAPVPALALALFWPIDRFAPADGWMLGGLFGLDAVGQIFLLLIAVLWTLAGFYNAAYHRHDPGRDRFGVFFLLAMTGNLGLAASFDLASFYLFFALMTFASFGLVVHDNSPFAHFAGKIYIAMAVLGEALLLSGLLALALHLPDWTLHAVPEHLLAHPRTGLVASLLFAGFGVKAGALFLHMWLPLAHPAAPTPASAVLSGAMIKAGLLGWLRFMPGGEASLPAGGAVVVALGLAAAFFGVALGLFQSNPKANLAYSSVSQMGFMTVGLGLGLIQPDLWPTTLLVVSLYALHHALAKGALFLAVGIAHHAVRRTFHAVGLDLGIALAALSLAGMPLTSGYLAKYLLKNLGADLPAPWVAWVNWLLPLAAVGTTLLLGRFLALVRRDRLQPHEHKPGLWAPWLTLLALVVALTWLAPLGFRLEAVSPPGLHGDALGAAFWPVALGLLLVALAAWRRWQPLANHPLPPGDLIIPATWAHRRIVLAWRRLIIPASTRLGESFFAFRNRALLTAGRLMTTGEAVIIRWGAGGVLFIVLILLVILFAAMLAP